MSQRKRGYGWPSCILVRGKLAKTSDEANLTPLISILINPQLLWSSVHSTEHVENACIPYYWVCFLKR